MVSFHGRVRAALPSPFPKLRRFRHMQCGLAEIAAAVQDPGQLVIRRSECGGLRQRRAQAFLRAIFIPQMPQGNRY